MTATLLVLLVVTPIGAVMAFAGIGHLRNTLGKRDTTLMEEVMSRRTAQAIALAANVSMALLLAVVAAFSNPDPWKRGIMATAAAFMVFGSMGHALMAAMDQKFREGTTRRFVGKTLELLNGFLDAGLGIGLLVVAFT